jgi:hypothetical protein
MREKTLTYHFHGAKAKFTQTFYPPLDCSRGAKLCVSSFDTYFSGRNVTKKNNSLQVGETEIHLPEGHYSILEICDAIAESFEAGFFKLTPLYALNKVQLECKADVNFNIRNTIADILGFDKKVYVQEEVHICEHSVKMHTANSIGVHCSNCFGAFLNGKPTGCVFNVPVNVPPGFKIHTEPQNLLYYPIKDEQLTELTFWIKNDELKLLQDWHSHINFSVNIVVALE